MLKQFPFLISLYIGGSHTDWSCVVSWTSYDFFNSFTEQNLIGNNEIVVPSSSIKKHYTFLMYTFEGGCEGDGDGS